MVSLILEVLLHGAPWVWTVRLKSKPQGRLWNAQLVFVVWQLSRYPSPATWARKPRCPTGSVHLNIAVLVLQVYCFDMIAGEQGAAKNIDIDIDVRLPGGGSKNRFLNIHTPIDFSHKPVQTQAPMHTLTCGDVSDGSRCTVTLVSQCSDCSCVGLTTQKVC